MKFEDVEYNENVSQILTVQWQINGICIKCAIS